MDLADAIEYIRPSIVQIAVLPSAAADGTQLKVLGTGFWVSENGLAMTARHVIEDAQRLMASLPESRLVIGQSIPSITDPEFTIRGSFNYLGSEIVEEDPRHDIALIQAVQNPFATGQRPFIKTPRLTQTYARDSVSRKHSSLKERAGVKRGFGLRFRGSRVFQGMLK